MSNRVSQAQLDVMDELKDGAVIHVYRGSRPPDLRAFVSNRKGGVAAMTIRVSTFIALAKKKVITRTKKLDWDDWAGDWILAK